MSDDTDRIRQRLAEYYEPDDIERWLTSPQPLLDGAVALNLIAAGNAAAVDRLLDQLEAGVYV